MANKTHLKILKQGVDTWNQWRKENPTLRPNLSGVQPDLNGVSFEGVSLVLAKLMQANLSLADLSRVNFSGALLVEADLIDANLGGANLSQAKLMQANLIGADLRGADLSEADLSEAIVGYTTFGNVDLSTVKGIETIKHQAPSTIGIDTIYLSQGRIPEIFLRGAGVGEDFISVIKGLAGSIQFYSCFISYSSQDQEFAERLYADLQAKGVRCWLASEDLKIGEPFRQRIDDEIRLHDKLLVVLSETSVASSWVESEVEAALERERRTKRKVVLFPICLDQAVDNTEQAWAADIRRQRHMGDFRNWQDHNAYQKALQRLLRDLKGAAGSVPA